MIWPMPDPSPPLFHLSFDQKLSGGESSPSPAELGIDYFDGEMSDLSRRFVDFHEVSSTTFQHHANILDWIHSHL